MLSQFGIKNVISFIFHCHLVFLPLLASTAAQQNNTKPSVLYRIVEAGSNFSLSCPKRNARTKIQWLPPSTSSNLHYYTQNNVKPLNQRTVPFTTPTTQQSRTQFLILNVTDAFYLDTGNYICRDDNTNKVIKEEYIFVKDRDHLLLPPATEQTSSKNETPIIHTLFSQTNVVIGCAPTIPSADVELRKFGDTSIHTVATSKRVDTNWSFSPYSGFTINKINSWEIAGDYKCVATDPYGYQFSDLFEIEIHGIQVIPTSNIESVKANTPFEITCRGRKSETMTLLWRWIKIGAQAVTLAKTRLPPGMPDMTELKPTVFANNNSSFFTHNIKWKKIPVEASGIYQCSDPDDDSIPIGVIQLNVLPASVSGGTTDTNSGRGIINRSSLTHQSDTIFQAETMFKLSCFDPNPDSNLEWIKHSRADDSEYYKRSYATTLNERSSIESRHYGVYSYLDLTVTNASFLDTGYYACNRADGSNIIRQFIYIEDQRNLILPAALRPVGPNRDQRVIGHYSEHDVPVGCGPTHPDVQVVLKKFDDGVSQVIASSTDPSDPNSDYTFDPYIGFKIKMVDSWEMKGQHSCEGTWTKTSQKTVTPKFKLKIQGVEVTPLDNTTSIFEGDQVNLTCRSKNKDTMIITWRWLPFDPVLAKNNSFIEIDANHLPAGGKGYSHPFENETSDQEYPAPLGTFQVHRLRWEKIPIEAAGIYQCYDAYDLNIPVSNITLNVSVSEAPNLENPDNEDLEVQRGSEMSLVCRDTAAKPKPKIQWFEKTGDKIEEIGSDRPKYFAIKTSDDGHTSTLVIHYPSADAEYRCNVSTSKGYQEKYFTVNVYGLSDGIIAAIAIVSIIVVVIIILIGRFVRSSHQQKRVYQELINNRLKLLEGNLDRINPNKPLADQLDLLPYDSKYEFPINHLVLGKQLGAGQFGRVLKAKAVGMGPGNTTVAVKMVKSQTDNTGLTSLASELKILIHLGCHMNVVNLLGACTKQLIKGELLVIVEFCRFGNLQDYLMQNRSNFINELDDVTYALDVCRIQKDAPRPPASNCETLERGMEPPEANDDASKTRYWFPTKKDESATRRTTVCVHDLMNWSYQVSCGMNYLTRRKVLHGDLAARNVLLADDDVVKIADFGLSRQVYQDCNYQKQGQEALPVKWMAIESLLDRVFSSQSDVWAFGVTVWEFFSLSQQPYPEVGELSDLIRLLRAGHRMEKPAYAPEAIGKILADCWKHNPEERATFSQLEEELGQLVDTITRQRYANQQQSVDNYLRMSTTETPKNNDMPEYLRMTSIEQAAANQQSIYQNISASTKLPKLFPELNTYMNTVKTALAPLVPTPDVKANKNPTSNADTSLADHALLSPAPSLADSNYLQMHPATSL